MHDSGTAGLPNEGSWIPIGHLDTGSGKLVVCDLMRLFCHRKSDVLAAQAGRYQLSIREVDGDGRWVSRLRISRGRRAMRRSRIRDVEVDSGRLVVFDPVALGREKRRTDEEARESLCEQLGSVGPVGMSSVGQLPVAIVQPGLGDGCYPVFDLVQAETLVGFEIVFLGPEALSVADGDLISQIRGSAAASALERLFHHRVKDLSGSGNPTLFDDLALQLSPGTAFSLTTHAAELVLCQKNAALALTALGLLLNLVRASDTTEMPPGLQDRWAALEMSVAKHGRDWLLAEMWRDLRRWYRR
jgi:hypothetical protein